MLEGYSADQGGGRHQKACDMWPVQLGRKSIAVALLRRTVSTIHEPIASSCQSGRRTLKGSADIERHEGDQAPSRNGKR